MNNKEKRNYISRVLLSQSTPYLSEMPSLYDYLSSTPSSLFKYRSFDRYAWEMLEEPYAFLAPVKNLDDPFDCLNKSGIDDFFNSKTKRLTNKGLSFLVDYFVRGSEAGGMTKAEIKKIARESMTDEGVDSEKFAELATYDTSGPNLFQSFLIVLRTINQNIEGLLNDSKLDGFAESALFSSERVGVCSLSKLRDNKVMWSSYGKAYSGYCVEYEIPKTKDVIFNLCPVIYTKKANNSFCTLFLRYCCSALLRGASDGKYGGEDIGSAMELFCTKDTDWSYQREWRFIGKPGAHLNLPIKAVYLGFKVSEANRKRILKLAKQKGFDLYRMNPPDGSKRISYTKVR